MPVIEAVSPLMSAYVAILRRRDGNVYVLLSQRRDNAMWELPGGCPLLSEEEYETAARETSEEIGVYLPHPSCRLLGEVKIRSKRFEGRHYAIFVYEDIYGGCEVGALCPKEVRDAKWRSIDDLSGVMPFQANTFFPALLQFCTSP